MGALRFANQDVEPVPVLDVIEAVSEVFSGGELIRSKEERCDWEDFSFSSFFFR